MFIARLCTEIPALTRVVVRPTSWLLLAVAAYVLLAPNVDFASDLTWHDGQRLAQLVLFGIVVLGLAIPGVGNAVADAWTVLSRWCRAVLFFAFALGLVSALQAHLWRWAMLEWATLLLLLVVALGVAAGRRTGGTSLDRVLVAMLFATATAYTVKAVVVYFAMLFVGAQYGMGFNVRELYTGFSNIRFFGHVQTMILPFLFLPALWWASTLRQRLLLGVVPVLWWMLAVASGTRGTWVALTIGVLAVLLFGRKSGQRWIRWQIAGLVCGLMCYAVFVLLVPSFFEQQTSFLHRTEDIISLSRRDVIWAASMKFILANPLLGIGPMHFAYYANLVASHPHNAILQLMSEWGIPAALMFTAAFAVGGLVFAKRAGQIAAGSDARIGMTAVALLAALSGGAAQAMVDGILVMPVSQIVLALICGWALGFFAMETGNVARCGALEKWLGAALITLAVGAMAYGVLPDMDRIEQREKAYLATHPPDTLLLPRFWAQGWINE